MFRYRKKPVEIEAVQVAETEDAPTCYPEWLYDAIGNGVIRKGPERPQLIIETLEGNMLAREGDWIIRGVKGELYPCKPDIFASTYDSI